MCKSLPDGTGFESMKGQWRAAEAWRCVRAGENMGERAASVAMETPVSWRWQTLE